jgi:predicted RNA-binding Zn-ribbon protein involved in translation (DUF1610 family)
MKIGDYDPDVDPKEQAQKATESVSAMVERIEGYLFGSFDCPDCGRACKADTTYDTTLYEEVRSWHCPECESHFYRENLHGDDDLPQPEER